MNMVGGRRKRRFIHQVPKLFNLLKKSGGEETLIFKRFLQFTFANVFDLSGREITSLL